MEIKNDSQHYGIVEKFLHWLLALLIIILLCSGFFLDDIPKEIKHIFTNLHKLTGVFIFFLALCFLCWKSINVKPSLPSTMPRLQLFIARFVHHLLLLCVMIMPLAGWIMTTAKGKAPHIGEVVLNFPGIPLSDSLSRFCWQVHSTTAWILITLISLHTLGALSHAIINKDGILRRMWF